MVTVEISPQYYANRKRKIKNISKPKQYIRMSDEPHKSHKYTTKDNKNKYTQISQINNNKNRTQEHYTKTHENRINHKRKVTKASPSDRRHNQRY